MPLLGILSLLIQVCFAVHAVKTGRDRMWLFIIILFPGVGCMVYFFVELLPELRQSPQARRAGSEIVRRVAPERELRRLKDQLEVSDSITNRKALAEGYIHAGRFDEAIPLYKSCLQGMYVDDPEIWEGLCCAHFFKGNFGEAKRHLYKLKEIKSSPEFDLLLARSLEESGEIKEALSAYADVVPHFPGEEARCRYALLLKKLGRTEEADNIFSQIIKEVRLSPKFHRKTQKKWVAIAKKEVSSPS